jgi:hypothetical protein
VPGAGGAVGVAGDADGEADGAVGGDNFEDDAEDAEAGRVGGRGEKDGFGIILQRTQIYNRDLCAKCACDTSDLRSLSSDRALGDVTCQVDLRSNGDICYGLSRQAPQTETNA